MTLTPAASLTLGNLRYDVHAASLLVPLQALPAVNSFRVSLPARAQLEAAAGDDAKLELDGGEGATTVITGKVARLSRGLTTTEVVGVDGGALLAALRPAATYAKQAAKEVIRALAGAASAAIGSIDLDLPLAAYVAHQRRTAAEHIAYLAQLAGAVAQFSGDGKLSVAAPSGRPELALRYGRELSLCRVLARAPGSRRVALGNGPAGSTSAPDALRPTTARLPSDAPEPGAGAIWEAHALLRVPSAASRAGDALSAASAARAQRLQAQTFLLPKLRPGMTIEIQDLPDGLSQGPWLLTRVEHQLSPARGGSTRFEAVTAADGGGLLGAIGGLL